MNNYKNEKIQEGISVIVPIYNSSKYLHKCINSIIHQTYQNIEIVLVDDGSSDESREICDGYIKIDNRIKTIHKRHAGLPAARKTGIENASKGLLFFVDSDDWIEPELLSKLLSSFVQGSDMITSGLSIDFKDHSKQWTDSIVAGEYGRSQILDYIVPQMMCSAKINDSGIIQSACGKLFRTDKLNKSVMDLDDRLTWGEDGAIVYPYVLQADKIVITHVCGYHYVAHDDSMMKQKSCDVFEKILLLKDYLSNKMICNGKVMKPQIDDYIFTFIKSVIHDIYGVSVYRCYSDMNVRIPYLPRKSKVILYGAGIRGRKIADRILYDQEWNLVAWVDRDFERINREENPEIPINNPEVIVKLEYDYIIISVSDTTICKEIKKWLLENGVESQRISYSN